MDLIDGDVAKNIWGFFLEFDDNRAIASMSVGPPSGLPESDSDNDGDDGNGAKVSLDRRIDFQSIRSLRAVNKFFYNAFEEFCGWSRCALAIKREYRSLQNDANSLDNWNFEFRSQAYRANHPPPTLGLSIAVDNGSNWTLEQRQQVARILSRTMERKKLSAFRSNQLIRMLDRGPFTKDEKRLTNTRFCFVH